MEIIRDILAIFGGISVVLLGLSKFISDIWLERIKEKIRSDTAKELKLIDYEHHKTKTQRERYETSQFNVYIELWKTLQGLRLAVDTLWTDANNKNIQLFNSELKKAKEEIYKGGIFFEENHLKRLKLSIHTLEMYLAGKISLLELRFGIKRNIDIFNLGNQIQNQIEDNREFKDDFHDLLEELRISFKNKIS